MSILLIRHGETASNVSRIVQTPQTPLNERGAAQATLLARRLGSEPVGCVLSSDLLRAMMTAEPLAAAVGLDIEPLSVLQERNFGDLRGRTYESIGTDIMAPGYDPPGGESWELFHERVDEAWRRIVDAAQATSGALAVITHGLVCHSLATRHLSLPDGVDVPTRWGNTALTVISNEPPWQVGTINCTAHLQGEIIDDAGSLSGL